MPTILLPACLSLAMNTQDVDCLKIVVLVSPYLVFHITVVMLFPAVRVVFFVNCVNCVYHHNSADE